MWAFVSKYITDPCIKSIIIDDERGEVSIFELENGDHKVKFHKFVSIKDNISTRPIPVEEIIENRRTLTIEDGIEVISCLQGRGATSASIFVNGKLMSFRITNEKGIIRTTATDYVKRFMNDPSIMHVEVGDVKINRINDDFEVEIDDIKYFIRKPSIAVTKKDGIEIMKKYKNAKMLKLKTQDWELNFLH